MSSVHARAWAVTPVDLGDATTADGGAAAAAPPRPQWLVVREAFAVHSAEPPDAAVADEALRNSLAGIQVSEAARWI